MSLTLLAQKFKLESEKDLIPKILGLREGLKLQTQATNKRVGEHSWQIAMCIADTLLGRILKTVSYYDYLRNQLVHMVSKMISFNEEGIVFSDTMITSIPKSQFEKWGRTKQEFIDEVNEFWRNTSVDPAIVFAELTDWPDEDIKVNFILKIKA